MLLQESISVDTSKEGLMQIQWKEKKKENKMIPKHKTIPTDLEASNWCLQLDELLQIFSNRWSDLLACVLQANQTLERKKIKTIFSRLLSSS